MIRVTANGETPVRGRGRKSTPVLTVPEKPFGPTVANPTTRERLGGYKEQQPIPTAHIITGQEQSRYEDPPDRDWLKLITGAVFGFLAVCLIALGAILFSLPASPANIAWIHAETATIGILLVLLYLKK
jgi:hypothetical protein